MLFLFFLFSCSSVCLFCLFVLALFSRARTIRHIRRKVSKDARQRVAIVLWETPDISPQPATINTLSAFLSNPNICLRIGVVDEGGSALTSPKTGDVALVTERRDLQGTLPSVLALAATEASPADAILALDNCAVPSSLDIAQVLGVIDTEYAYGFLFKPSAVRQSWLSDFLCRLFCDLVPWIYAAFGAKGLVPHVVCAPKEKIMRFASDTYARHSINIGSAIFRQFPRNDVHLIPLFLNVSAGWGDSDLLPMFLKHLSLLWATSRLRYIAVMLALCALPLSLTLLLFSLKGGISLLFLYSLKIVHAVVWRFNGKKPGQFVLDSLLEVFRDIVGLIFMCLSAFKRKTMIAGKVYTIKAGGLLVGD